MLSTTNALNLDNVYSFLSDKSTASALAKITTEHTSSDTPSIEGIFNTWAFWSKTLGKTVESATFPELPPAEDGKNEPPTKFTVKFQRLSPVKGKTEAHGRDLERGTSVYRVLTRVDYAGERYNKKEGTTTLVAMPEGVPTAKELLAFWYQRRAEQGPDGFLPLGMNHALDVLLTDDIEHTPQDHVWFTLSENDTVPVSMFCYDVDQKRALQRKRSDGSPVIQDQMPVRLENISCSLRVSPYEAKEWINAAGVRMPIPDTATGPERFSLSTARNKYEFMCSRIIPVGEFESLTPAQIMDANYAAERTKKPRWVPYGQVQSGEHKAPWEQYFYVQREYVSPDGSFSRRALDNVSADDFLYTSKKTDEAVQKYRWSLLDAISVDGAPELYAINITAGDSKFKPGNPALSWGILDQSVSDGIALATVGFPCHIVARYGDKRTRENNWNSQRTDEERRAAHPPILGVYEYYAQKVVPDWAAGLPLYGVPLTKERVLSEFSEAAKRVTDKNARMFKESVDSDGERMILLKDAFTALGPNELHATGVNSRVINFGSGEAPAFSCDDASPLFDTMDFYALTNVPNAAGADFDELKRTPNFGYQIFGMRRTNVADPVVAANAEGKRERSPALASAPKAKQALKRQKK